MIALTLLLSLLVALVAANSTTCAKGAHVIVARGSLEPQGPGAMGELADKVLKLVPGSDMESLVYPALYNEYLDSQPAGVRTLTSAIQNYVKNCPKTQLVLMGYSQGAHVIMDTICGASSTGFPATLPQPSYITDKIASVILLGDPSLTEGQTFHVGTSVGSGMFPRNLPAGCDSIATKTVSVCDKGDPFCEAGGKELSVHLGYIPVWGDYVVKEVVKLAKAVVEKPKACS
ncbi:acetylxylan esterase 2 [Fusarium sporotrichioides]|uniref:Acetylxylan esterase 2 n=1 Tax=Fusarium sporotrichioides TaxID=5514 RepID=A0A395SLJ6_FUSSP|nr:acetylxylan esterase 2 [Fusarium sporotrichioides]